VPNPDARALALDHAHCRAICEEIGERLGQVLKPEALVVPRRLLMLLDRLAELEQAPSVVPSIDDMLFRRYPEPSARITQSTGSALLATNRKLASAGS
jgi:hypothetical protein